MAYRLKITESALADAQRYYCYLRDEEQSPDAAARWFWGLRDAMETLLEMPRRCPLIPEADQFEQELRHLQYFSHRIIFTIDEAARRLVVLRVYHGARDRLAGISARKSGRPDRGD